MDRTTRQLSRTYKAAQNAFDKRLFLAGVPRKYWAPRRNGFEFTTFKRARPWTDDDQPFIFSDHMQSKFFDGFIATLKGETEHTLDDYAGMLFCITSTPTENIAMMAAALLLKTFANINSAARIRCVDVSESAYAKIHVDEVPDICIIHGVSSKDTEQRRQLTRDWCRQASMHGLGILVGTGTDPIDLAYNKLEIDVDAALYGEGMANVASVESYG